jgi:hypothetical protein
VGVGVRSVLVSADSMVAYLTDMARSMEMGWRGGERKGPSRLGFAVPGGCLRQQMITLGLVVSS